METILAIEKEILNIPKTRFKEFNGEWKKKKLEDVAEKIQDGTHFSPNCLDDGPYKYLTSKNIRNGKMDLSNISYLSEKAHKLIYKRCSVKFNDILLTKDGASTGTVCLNELHEEFSLLSSVAIIRAKKGFYLNDFIYQYITSPKGQFEIRASIAGQAITRITLTKLRNFQFYYPALPEQQKIATFLSAVDKKIQQRTRKKELLETYKKGVMQQLFSQEIRFKDVDGKDFPKWEKKKFNEVFERVTRKNNRDNKNVLTISAQHGLINRLEHYNNSVAAKDLSNYYLLLKNEFAYNKSYSKGYPMGAIKKLTRYKEGVVSTLYICFKTKPSNSTEFFEHYFENGNFNKQLARIAQEGARNHGLLNLSVVEFFKDLIVFVPRKEEQQKIADFLSAIDKKIEGVSLQIEKTQQFKKGLLQQMFV